MRLLTGLEQARKWSGDRQTLNFDADTARIVADVISAVREDGDAALEHFTRSFDGRSATHLRVPVDGLQAAHAGLDGQLLDAIRLSINRVRAYYSHQQENGFSFSEADSQFGLLVRPLESVGCYVPGGQAPLFSTLIMTAVPAQTAGVSRVAVASPPDSTGAPHQAVLAVAHELGISEVYAVGGAQAVAALALGTGTVQAVDKIVGPGNRFVMEAKRQLFGLVGIESLPGPTETLVLADGGARPVDVIADLLAQAEHGGAVPVLVSDSEALIQAVLAGLPAAAAELPTAALATESLQKRGAAILVGDLAEGMQVANEIAPEHLCLLVDDPDALLPLVRNAGGIFVGHSTMEALGDYVAGPSHVMPTGRSARFSSFVNLRDFQKVMPVVRSSRQLVAEIGPAGARMARAEGLEAHARAIESRLG